MCAYVHGKWPAWAEEMRREGRGKSQCQEEKKEAYFGTVSTFCVPRYLDSGKKEQKIAVGATIKGVRTSWLVCLAATTFERLILKMGSSH